MARGWPRGPGVLVAAALWTPPAAAAPALPETNLSYTLDVALDPATRRLEGRVQLAWRHPGGAAVVAVPLHLYLNAFAHEQTTWMREVPPRLLDADELLARHPDPWGFIDVDAIQQRTAGAAHTVAWRPVQPDDGNPLDTSLAEVALAAPVAAGETLRLDVRFTARLPVPIARTGGRDDFFLVAQWFPKLAAFDARAQRFAARQFHALTEFAADFADYDVTITVPAEFVVGATGRVTGAPEHLPDGRVRLRHTQRAVHDFAFVAGRALYDVTHGVEATAGAPEIAVRYLGPARVVHQVDRLHRATTTALAVLGARVGPYPYDTLTVVSPPFAALRTGGMEYPTLVAGAFADVLWDGTPLGDLRLLETVLVHEIAHQYFYGLLASDEREDAFLDEGCATFWEGEIMAALEAPAPSGGRLAGRALDIAALRTLRTARDAVHEPVMKRPSWLYDARAWNTQIYVRPATSLATAANLHGPERVDAMFRLYYARHVFAHPDPADLLAAAADAGGPDLAAFLREALAQPHVPDYAVREVTSTPWRAPRGHAPPGDLEAATTGAAEGPVVAEVTDAGSAAHVGSVRRVALATRRETTNHDLTAKHDLHENHVILDGPAWQHLPVAVELRFADGTVARDHWDGRAAWRAYRIVHHAPLVDARIDPEGHIAVDLDPRNDGLRARPAPSFLARWAAWSTALAQWLAMGLALWL